MRAAAAQPGWAREVGLWLSWDGHDPRGMKRGRMRMGGGGWIVVALRIGSSESVGLGGVVATGYAWADGFWWGAISMETVCAVGVSGDWGGAWLCTAGMGEEFKVPGSKFKVGEGETEGGREGARSAAG